jgi:hypothetical protein
MKKIIAIGTSHTTDRHWDQKINDGACQKYYVNYHEENTWPEYLGDKLHTQTLNYGLGGLSIGTYYSRIIANHSLLKNNIALLEIPSENRFEHPLNEELYNNFDCYTQNFWEDPLTSIEFVPHYRYTLYRYSWADIDQDHSKFKKFHYINKFAKSKISSKELDNSFGITADYNIKYLQDNIISQCIVIDGFLKNNNVIPVWFSYNFPIEIYSDQLKHLNVINTCIDNQSILDHFLQQVNIPSQRIAKKNIEWFADGTHLNSHLWRELVDELFVDFIEQYL